MFTVFDAGCATGTYCFLNSNIAAEGCGFSKMGFFLIFVFAGSEGRTNLLSSGLEPADEASDELPDEPSDEPSDKPLSSLVSLITIFCANCEEKLKTLFSILS